MRVGIGVDFHGFVAGRKLILGGVEIPFERGLIGHSDADALTHAICDALLGAAGLGDIGKHFPDTDERFRDVSSLELLKQVNSMLKAKGHRVHNIDAVVVAEAPKLAPYFSEMIGKLAAVLRISSDQINIKATTTEGMGAIGRVEGVAAFAMANLSEQT